jgi:uncharacterized membrane protein
MPYCVQCGNGVGGSDRFCGKCGTAQLGATSGPGPGFGKQFRTDQFVGGLTNRNAALLCYIPWLGWIAAIFVLASDRFRHDRQVRFHAFQGLYLFVTWMIVDWVFVPMLSIPERFYEHPMLGMPGHLLQLVIFCAWIFMLIKVSHGEDFHLPVLGEMAERSASEQRT